MNQKIRNHHWSLECSACGTPFKATGPTDTPVVCRSCGQPLFARYSAVPPSTALQPRSDAWRYSAFLPLCSGEEPVSLGEGFTPLIRSPQLAAMIGVRRLEIKDEGRNPTGSFKARGMSAVLTRARYDGAPGIVVPTAGNAGAALAAYGAAAGIPVKVFAPRTTPSPILATIAAFGADLVTIDGHIGDAGRLSAAFAAEHGWQPIPTLKEPYRVEGMKTMGLELAEQLGWTLPDVVVYPTGGGEGTIGIWKAFHELINGGWLPAGTRLPRFVVAQASGCAPLVTAFNASADHAEVWPNPHTQAAGLRVPGPFGDRILLRILRETDGIAAAASEEEIAEYTGLMTRKTGIDAAPEGGCALAVLHHLVTGGTISSDSHVVVFNTGAGSSYRA